MPTESIVKQNVPFDLVPIARMWERVNRSREDGDTALFMELLYLGELITKLTIAAAVSTVGDDRDRHRYRQLHRLVRADGLGEWALVLDEVLTGATAQHIIAGARDAHRQLTERISQGSWQYDSVRELDDCLCLLASDGEELPLKVDGRRWFTLFSALRNRTRGHGALSAPLAGRLCVKLERSSRVVAEQLALLNAPWVYLHRNLSGKYRVTELIPGGAAPFAHLKASNTAHLKDGVHVWFGEPLRVDLIQSDAEATDFYLPNGNFNGKRFELISYITNDLRDADASPYLSPATALPASETEGNPVLDVQGEAFANLPPCPTDYVRRPEVECELLELLTDDRHPIVTVAGRGGIGKTSLALAVLHQLVEKGRFQTIVWLRARDVDLLFVGPKPVRPQVLTITDMAKDLVRLLCPTEAQSKGFKAVDYFAERLKAANDGPTLVVLDNFETVKVPAETYAWIDTYVRLPNKILITTRTRDFKGDYPVELSGMTEDEYDALVNATASRLGISELISSQYRQELYRETEGHPYVVKILLGEVANARRQVKVERILATKDDVLTALFERTYAGLSPAARRVFLTLCGWRSLVAQVALEAVLLRAENERIDVDGAIEELSRASLIEHHMDEGENLLFLGVPLTAALFGKQKLAVSSMAPAVEADLQLLREFGAAQSTDVRGGMGPRIERLFGRIAERMTRPGESLEKYVPMLEFLARRYPKGWLLLARLYEEMNATGWVEEARKAVRMYLQSASARADQVAAWRKLAWLCERAGDPAEEAHALVKLAELPDATFGMISSAANRLNALFSGPTGTVDLEAKRILAARVIKLMESRIAEADATDLSRLAWLNLHLRNEDAAKRYTTLGLTMQAGNVHLGNLAERLGLGRDT
jgi:hypothetical protein